MPTDVVDEDQVVALFETAVDRFGRVDLLVNCAGVPQATPTEEMSLVEWRTVIDANLTSVFLCAREALKLMKPAGRGRIITIGSVAARMPRPDAVAYVAAKAGLDGLNRALALEGRDHGVACSLLHPGFTVTGFGPGADGGVGHNAMDPNEVARIVVLMATPARRAEPLGSHHPAAGDAVSGEGVSSMRGSRRDADAPLLTMTTLLRPSAFVILRSARRARLEGRRESAFRRPCRRPSVR